MDEIMRILALIILGLLGITSYQARKAKDLKQDIQKAQETANRKEKELGRIDETQQKITIIAQEKPPEKVDPPAASDAPGRLARLNKLHERANGRGD
jgi:hypothetical protein